MIDNIRKTWNRSLAYVIFRLPFKVRGFTALSRVLNNLVTTLVRSDIHCRLTDDDALHETLHAQCRFLYTVSVPPSVKSFSHLWSVSFTECSARQMLWCAELHQIYDSTSMVTIVHSRQDSWLNNMIHSNYGFHSLGKYLMDFCLALRYPIELNYGFPSKKLWMPHKYTDVHVEHDFDHNYSV